MAYRNDQRLPLEADGSGPVLRLSVNPRARRLSVRIDARAGEAVVIAPTERGLTQAVAFARTKAVWISEQLAVRPKGRPLEPGQVISLKGRPVPLEAVAGADFAPLRGAEKVFTDGSDGAGRRIITSLCAPFVAAGLELWAGLVIGISGKTTRGGRAGSRNGRWGAGAGARVRTA